MIKFRKFNDYFLSYNIKYQSVKLYCSKVSMINVYDLYKFDMLIQILI